MLKEIKEYLEKNQKVNIAFALLFVSSLLILSQIQENITDIKASDLEIITSNTFIVFGTIVILSICIYTIVDLFFDKSDHDRLSKDLNNKLHLVQSMLETKGLETIVTDKEIEEEEKKSNEIILIVEDLFLDISPEFNTEFQTDKQIGSYFDEVHNNIKNGKQYTYYLKYDNNTHKAIELHNQSHYNNLKNLVNVKEPLFILIPSNEYNFFSDIYIYIDIKENKKAYEYLPSLIKENIDTQQTTLFYLQFDKNQVSKLSHILTNTKKIYGVTLASNLEKYEEFIINQSQINKIEKEAHNIEIITDSLQDDIKGGQFFEPVSYNIKNDKTYTYYVPNTSSIHDQINQYKEDHNQNNESYRFILIPSDMFLFYSNIFIYDKDNAFEFISSTKQYFKYDKEQCKKIQFSLEKLEKGN